MNGPLSDMPNANRSRCCILAQAVYLGGGGLAREVGALTADGFDVDVVCLRRAGEASRESIGDARVHRIALARAGPFTPGFVRYAFDANVYFIRASLALLSLHIARRFDVIQIDNPPDALVFSALLPRVFGARVVLRLREPAPERSAATFRGRWYARALVGLERATQRAALAFAHHAVASGREMREACGRAGADVNTIAAIVEVPDAVASAPERRERYRERVASVKKDERRRGRFRVLCHGAFERGGELETLLAAVGRLRDDVPGVEVRVSGAVALPDSVQDLADDHVRPLGDLAGEAFAEEILAADVAVVASPRTPYAALVLPGEVFEYAALGCIVVAPRLPAMTSYFPEDTLVYFAPGDADDLAGKLHTVFAHPEEMPARAAAAAKIVETYRWERERKKYLGVFHRLVSTPRAGER